ncbi:MAG: hypothetical protein CMP63_07040 [Flavobacteriales bacterium]|nr:hypothetical protein [Flavobacteriales bacterium]|tara:strand:- start:334 stop:1431 length:1098 start_codon:yes stop_codon:yes gene_type:complete
MKNTFLIAFIALMALCSFAQNDSTKYSFFVAGHTYGKPGVNNPGFHPPFKDKFNYIQSRTEIKFGVLTGDIVSPFPVAQDWDEIDADIDTLGLPVYFAVGNHDMENRPLFESRYDSTYYHFVYENDLFIVLDPNIDGWNISGNQLSFLKQTLASNSENVSSIFIFFHQILWKEVDNEFNYIRWNSSAGRHESINFWSEVEPLFSDLDNQVIMFAGDLGASWSSDVSYDKYDNITLISTGMGDEYGDNFIIVNVKKDNSIKYDLICLSDTSLNCLGQLTDYQVVDMITNYHQYSTDPKNVDNIWTESLIEFENPTLYIFDIQGKLVLEKKTSDQTKPVIKTNNIPPGFYIAKIIDNHHQMTIKFYK